MRRVFAATYDGLDADPPLFMLKLKDLRHPLQSAAAARARLDAHLDLRRSVERSERRYAADPRYDLENVTRGFASNSPQARRVDPVRETALLWRICTAYRRAVEDAEHRPSVYRSTDWWQHVRTASLQTVMQALQAGDVDALRAMYRNFYRNTCSNGLVDLPADMAKACTSVPIGDLYRRFWLGDALHRIDYWSLQLGPSYELEDLTGPEIGNPFGVVIDEALIRTGSPYQHYCAHRVIQQLPLQPAAVAEIGAGYGGMAYYLLRDRSRLTYLSFDLPESLALTAYYLSSAYPSLTFLLYGEAELTTKTMQQADVVLMPPFELPKLPSKSVDVSFSSCAISDLSQASMSEYMKILSRSTKNCFLEIGSNDAVHSLSEIILYNKLPLRLIETRLSDWNRYRYTHTAETECLFRCDQ